MLKFNADQTDIIDFYLLIIAQIKDANKLIYLCENTVL